MRKSFEERFWSKVKLGSECWKWQAATDRDGYGRFWIQGRLRGPHRISYEMTYGSIPDRLFVCHTCDNPGCVRPDHLFLGTQQDNMNDCVSKGRRANASGEKHGRYKLTEEKVLAILKDTRPQKEIAKDYSVSVSHISKIKNRKYWIHIDV